MKSVVALLLLGFSPCLLLAAEPSVEALAEINAQAKTRDGKIYELRVRCEGYTDAEYQLIGQLRHLKRLSISGKDFHDQQLKMLSGLSELESMMIDGGQLTDEGFKAFAQFPKLESLSLFHPSRKLEAFTGEGLVHLKAVPTLRSLTFAGATAGDEAFAAVGEVTQLESFREWHNTETAAGLEHLPKLTNLKSIRLGQRLPSWGKGTPASFDDKSLSYLAMMPSLETIELTEARLHASGILKLKSLPQLKTIKIHQVDISAEEIQKLHKAMPQVKLDWQPLTEEQAEMLTKKLKL